MDRLDGGRSHRRDTTGWATGALSCAALGAVIAALLPGLGAEAVVVGGLLGGVVGAALGLKLARRIDAEEFDPEDCPRPYVGTRARDAET